MQHLADIHTHILPGIDDGAKTLDDALAMLQHAYSQGTRLVFLTPHYRGNFRAVTAQQRLSAAKELRHAAAVLLPELRLELGTEIAYAPGFGEKLQLRELLSYAGGDYILLEFGDLTDKKTVLQGLEEALNCGFVPVVAHAERVDCFRKGLSLLRQAVEMGALIQLNADSVMGQWGGFFLRRWCDRALKEGLVHFIASDAHDLQHRPPELRRCYSHICKQYGEEYANALFWENARLLLPEE